MKIYELNCDCTPFYLRLTDAEADRLRAAIAPIKGFVELVEIVPLEISPAVLEERIKLAIASDNFAVKGFFANEKIEAYLTLVARGQQA